MKLKEFKEVLIKVFGKVDYERCLGEMASFCYYTAKELEENGLKSASESYLRDAKYLWKVLEECGYFDN